MKPKRIQLSRKKGWKMPPNTVVVSRPGRWGNPFRVGVASFNKNEAGLTTPAEAVRKFREWVLSNSGRVSAIQNDLRGKNLACWCKPGEPCHADVLLEVANG